MDSEHITALSNLASNAFSRDCYFYYIVPDEELETIAQHFNDFNWIEYSKLNSSERLTYRKTRCRTGSSSSDDTDFDDNSSTVSELEESTEEEQNWLIAAPFYPLKASGVIISSGFNLLMHLLLIMLLFKLLNDIISLNGRYH